MWEGCMAANRTVLDSVYICLKVAEYGSIAEVWGIGGCGG